ncbi:MAG: hypothetical protein AB4041_13705 [Microcystaceae cyanobacterium]
MGKLCFSFILIVAILAMIQPAYALPCYHYHGNEICILRLKRSAKNYWEYRGSAKLNGKLLPNTIYNCRNRIKIFKNGDKLPFQPDGVGEFICQAIARK